MRNDNEILESLLLGGLIGSALGALISKNEKKGAAIGAIAGAVLLSTFKANESAISKNIPVFVEENGYLYEINANGEKKMIKKIDKSLKIIPKTFKLN